MSNAAASAPFPELRQSDSGDEHSVTFNQLVPFFQEYQARFGTTAAVVLVLRYGHPWELSPADRAQLLTVLRDCLQRGIPYAPSWPSQDRAARERDAMADRVVVTNTPRPGDTLAQIAARRREPVQHPKTGYATGGYVGGPEARAEPELRDPYAEAAAVASQSVAELKDNNPKDAFGVLKASMSWVPLEVILELAVAMAEGGMKYGGHNYAVAAPRGSVYVDAADRHMRAFWTMGQDIDPPSGVHHVTKAIASLTVLRSAQIRSHWVDDRPPPVPVKFLDDLNAKMEELARRNPDPVARYLAGGKRGPGRILHQ
ncbi:dATP/dGTP diphosphohydrolase domain-containing protein [Rhodopseudomonas palustris]